MLELLLVILLVALMTLWSTSHQHAWFLRQQSNSVFFTLRQAVIYGRLIAIEKSTKITLCGSRDAEHCDNSWEKGILVMHADFKMFYFSMPTGFYTLQWNGFGCKSKILFNGLGMIDALNGHFNFVSQDAKFSWKAVLNKAGRLRKA